MRVFLDFYLDWFSCIKDADTVGWLVLWLLFTAFVLFISPRVFVGSLLYTIGSIPIHYKKGVLNEY